MSTQFSRSLDQRFYEQMKVTYPPLPNRPGTSVSTTISPVQEGEVKTMNYNKSVDFRPGRVFKIGEIHSTRTVSHCVHDTVSVKHPTYGIPDRILSGPIANECFSAISPSIPTTDLTRMSDRAKVQAATQMFVPDIDLAVNLFEAGQTLSLISAPFILLKRGFRRLVRPRSFRRSRHPPRSALTYASDAWMSYRYGIMPLVSDIQAIRHRYAHHIYAATNRWYVRKGFDAIESNMTVLQSQLVRLYTPMRVVHSGHTKAHAAARIYFEVVDPRMYELGRLGLNPRQIGALIWELVPLSFVIDWAVGVGDWLRLAAPHPEVRTLGICLGTKKLITNKCSVQSIAWNSSFLNASPCTSVTTQTIETFDRILTASLPTTPLVNESVLNIRRVFDSLSLAWQHLPKFRR